MRFNIFFLLLWIGLFSGCGQSGETPSITWDMPTPYASGVFHTQNIQQFATEVSQLTNNRIAIQIHPDASLYKHPEIKRAIQTNQVPIGEILMSLLGNESPLYQMDSLPLLATSYQQAHRLWHASRPEIEALLETQDLKILFAVPWPPQGLYTKKTINSLEDMRGLKVRVYNAMLSRLAELLGASPSTVQTPEVPQAFSTGVIEAMITSSSTGVSTQAWDYVSCYYDIQAWIPKNMVIVNKTVFDGLPTELQSAILQAAAHAEERGWQMSEKETEEKTRTLAAHGIKIITPTDSFKSALINVREQMMKEWQIQAGPTGEKVLKAFQNTTQ